MASIQSKKQDVALGLVVKSLHSANFSEALSYFVKKLVSFDNLIVIAYHKSLNPQVLYREYQDPVVYQTMDTDYVNAAYLLDPFYQAVTGGVQTGIHRIFELAPDQFKQTSYFREYYSQTTLVDEFAVFVRVNHDTTITVCFGRDKTSGMAFKKSELNAVRAFEHLLCALCEQQWKDFQPQQGNGISLPPVTERLRNELKKQHDIGLSARQSEVALFILQGHSSLSISLNLNISKETVKVFRRQLYAKCNISSQAELFALLMPIFSSL